MPVPNEPENPDCIADFNALRRQLAALHRFQSDAAEWDPLLRRLMDETTSLPVVDAEDRPACAGLLPTDPGQSRTPHVAGEILVSAPDGLLGDVERVLQQFGFDLETSRTIVPRVGEGQPVVLYRSDDVDVDVRGAVAAIRQLDGATANANVLRVMNVVTKSKSGAEPACCVPEPEAVAVDNENHESGLVVVLDTGIFPDHHANDWLASIDDSDADPLYGGDGKLNLSAGHGHLHRRCAPPGTPRPSCGGEACGQSHGLRVRRRHRRGDQIGRCVQSRTMVSTASSTCPSGVRPTASRRW